MGVLSSVVFNGACGSLMAREHPELKSSHVRIQDRSEYQRPVGCRYLEEVRGSDGIIRNERTRRHGERDAALEQLRAAAARAGADLVVVDPSKSVIEIGNDSLGGGSIVTVAGDAFVCDGAGD
jgi:hypothetical protein